MVTEGPSVGMIVSGGTDGAAPNAIDTVVVRTKSVSDPMRAPVQSDRNGLACFADEYRPNRWRIARDSSGRRATSDRSDVPWTTLCPTDRSRREVLFEWIDRCIEANENLHLWTVGFSHRDYCRCTRCRRRAAASDAGSWREWRRETTTALLRAIRAEVPGNLSVSIHPDPHPESLSERTGIRLDAVNSLCDEVIIPLCDPHYETTYWIDSIVTAFTYQLSIPLGVQLSVDAPLVNVERVISTLNDRAETVYLSGDSNRIVELLDRIGEGAGIRSPMDLQAQ